MIFLFTATVIWGLSYPINRHGLDMLHPWALSGFRYFFGSLFILPMVLRWRRHPAPATYGSPATKVRLWWLWGGLVCGVLLSIGAGFQLYGLAHTTASKAGFITALYVTLVPVLGFVLGQIPRPMVWVGLVMGVAGLVMLTGGGAGGHFTPGDGLMLVANLF